MGNELRITPKNLAQLLDVPLYLFSDLLSIQCELRTDGSIIVNDPETPSVNGTKIMNLESIKLDHFIPIGVRQ